MSTSSKIRDWESTKYHNKFIQVQLIRNIPAFMLHESTMISRSMRSVFLALVSSPYCDKSELKCMLNPSILRLGEAMRTLAMSCPNFDTLPSRPKRFNILRLLNSENLVI